MGRKAKRMNEAQARQALEVAEEAFKTFNSIYSLIHDDHRKAASIVGRYHTIWLFLQRFKDLMELEMERVCLD